MCLFVSVFGFGYCVVVSSLCRDLSTAFLCGLCVFSVLLCVGALLCNHIDVLCVVVLLIAWCCLSVCCCCVIGVPSW